MASQDDKPAADDALGDLYREVGHLVYRRCLMILRDPQEAMDVTQWTFIRAIETRFEVRSRAEALSWLYQTASRRCLAWIRDESNRRRLRAVHAPELRGSAPPTPEHHVAGREILNKALKQVDAKTAEIALMTHVQGISVERTAELTGISVRTIARARRKFEACLKELSSTVEES